MFIYRLFSHDGLGNFTLLREFKAQNDQAAEASVSRWAARPLELWQGFRTVNRWA
jgi:hypothetical protein